MAFFNNVANKLMYIFLQKFRKYPGKNISYLII